MNTRLILSIVIVVLISEQGIGQSFWVNQNNDESNVTLEWTKPFFGDDGLDDNDKISFISTSGFLSGKYKITERFEIYIKH